MLRSLIESGLKSVEGEIFLSPPPSCPSCNSKLTGFDTVQRRFATLIRDGETENIMVQVKRFQCLACKKVFPAIAPFYPETRYGKPVIDLVRALLETNSANRVTVILREMGVFIDRGTVISYKKRDFDKIGVMDLFGFKIPISVIELTTMS